MMPRASVKDENTRPVAEQDPQRHVPRPRSGRSRETTIACLPHSPTSRSNTRHYAPARQGSVDLDAEAASRELILDVKDAEAAARLQRVRHEVEHPDRVRPGRLLQRRPRASDIDASMVSST